MKRGFTLIELLASITILALLALVAIPAINRQLHNGQENLYSSQIESIKSSASIWAADNAFKMPSDGECITLTLGYLKDLGYVDNNIIDPKSKESLSDNNVFVNITKDNNSYIYEVKTEGNKCAKVDSAIE